MKTKFQRHSTDDGAVWWACASGEIRKCQIRMGAFGRLETRYRLIANGTAVGERYTLSSAQKLASELNWR